MSFVKVLSRIERTAVDETRDNHTVAIDKVFRLDVLMKALLKSLTTR